MKLALLVYLAGLSGGVVYALQFIAILIGLICVFSYLERDDKFKKYLIVFCVTILFCASLPSKSTVYTMIIASDDRVQNIGNDALDIIESKLEEIKKAEK